MPRSRRALVWVALVWLALAAGACAHRPMGDPVPTAPPAARAHDDAGVRFALRYWQFLQTLPPAALAAEYARVDTAQRRHTADLHARIQLALLRALPRTPFHDTAGALALVDSSLDALSDGGDAAPAPDGTDSATGAVEDLLWFMRSLIQEQRNAEQHAQAHARTSRELRSQLEQLKSIERSLQDRALPNAPGQNAPTQGAP